MTEIRPAGGSTEEGPEGDDSSEGCAACSEYFHEGDIFVQHGDKCLKCGSPLEVSYSCPGCGLDVLMRLEQWWCFQCGQKPLEPQPYVQPFWDRVNPLLVVCVILGVLAVLIGFVAFFMFRGLDS